MAITIMSGNRKILNKTMLSFSQRRYHAYLKKNPWPAASTPKSSSSAALHLSAVLPSSHPYASAYNNFQSSIKMGAVVGSLCGDGGTQQTRPMSTGPPPRPANFQETKCCDPEWQGLLEKEDHVLLDVRTVEEFKEKQIPGSINIQIKVTDDPVVKLQESASKLPVAKDTPMLVYCAVGGRSNIAAGGLRALGYSNVKNAGGIDEVKEAVTYGREGTKL
ncbi:unnamed protein product [Amoebophrya sp. A25]|nr:unnamed protein product [Amoebophrya sp. A25]|eukprot:GSA25T00010091001.1